MREIALDTETTGLSFVNGDKIIEIGCIEIIDKKITGKTYHTYINPEQEVSDSAYKISGLTYDFLKQFKTFSEIYRDFLEFIDGGRLIIHNAQFDIGFLNNELSIVGASLIREEIVVDTLIMAKEKYPGSPMTLDALCRRFSIDSSKRTKHGALVDAELLAEVYINMSVELFQKDIFGASQNIEETNDTFGIPKNVIQPRSFVINESELKAHEEFLRKIKNPIWNVWKNHENPI